AGSATTIAATAWGSSRVGGTPVHDEYFSSTSAAARVRATNPATAVAAPPGGPAETASRSRAASAATTARAASTGRSRPQVRAAGATGARREGGAGPSSAATAWAMRKPATNTATGPPSDAPSAAPGSAGATAEDAPPLAGAPGAMGARPAAP